MTPRQIELVQSSWDCIAPAADHAARLFYLRLFDEQPEIRASFRTSVSGQEGRLADALTASVKQLENGANDVSELETLGRLHVLNGICAKRYEAVADALLWMLEQELGPKLDSETRLAWNEAYCTMANTMLGSNQATLV